MSSAKVKCYDCKEDCTRDKKALVCTSVLVRGSRQHVDRWYHRNCADTKGWTEGQPWFCDDCKMYTGGHDSSSKSTARTASNKTDSSAANSSDAEPEWDVAGILKSGIKHDDLLDADDILHFTVDWVQPTNGTAYRPSTDPFWFSEAEAPERRYYAEDDTREFPAADEISDEDKAAGNFLLAPLADGYWNVLDMLATDVMAHHAAQALPHNRDNMKAEIFAMLTSVRLAVLYGIAGAGLRARKAKDENLYAWLVLNLNKAKKRPAVYVLEFTDQLGRAPSIEDMQLILTDIESYLNATPSVLDVATTIRIDNAGGRDLSKSEKEARGDAPDDSNRRYLTSEKARKNMAGLVESLRREIRDLFRSGSSLKSFMPFVLRDIGYADNGFSRLKVQENLKSGSNPLMSLFNAVARTNETFVKREQAAKAARAQGVMQYALEYRMHGDVIFLAFRREHASLGEIVFSLLASSYVNQGRGFNGVDAGIQNTSNNQYSLEHFEAWEEDVWSQSPMSANHKAEGARIAEVRAIMEDTERIEMENELGAAISKENLTADVEGVVKLLSEP